MKLNRSLGILILFVFVMPEVLGLTCELGSYSIPCNNLPMWEWAIIIGVGIVLLLAMISWWVIFIDVLKRDVNKKALWILVILLGSFVGGIIYYFTIQRKGNRGAEDLGNINPLVPPKETTPIIQSPQKETVSVIQSPPKAIVPPIQSTPKEIIPPIQPPKESVVNPPAKLLQTVSEKPNLEKIREQLINYREATLAKGYTKEQIKETFLGKGYPSYLIDEILGA